MQLARGNCQLVITFAKPMMYTKMGALCAHSTRRKSVALVRQLRRQITTAKCVIKVFVQEYLSDRSKGCDEWTPVSLTLPCPII